MLKVNSYFEEEETVFLTRRGRKFCAVFAVFLSLAMAGCGNNQADEPKAIDVKTMRIVKKDTRVVNEYAGQIQGQNEVMVQARVSGHIVEKYIKGGQMVKKGDPLFKIDNRQYTSAYLSAQAQLSQAEATLANTRIDTGRYRGLYKEGAIAEQMLTTQESLERQQSSLVNSYSALCKKAHDDLSDTMVVSPIDGRLYVDDVSIGEYVQPGVTKLVTVGVMDPVYSQFNISETEYLEMRKLYQNNIEGSGWGSEVTITLSDDSLYPYSGQVTQIDRGMGSNSSTLTVKASFANPDGVLLPGMFSRVRIEGLEIKDAVLVPQRAVQQVLEKAYVMVLMEDNKIKAKNIELGRKTGSFWVVEKGLDGDEAVVVEGLTKVQDGVAVNPILVQPQDLELVFE